MTLDKVRSVFEFYLQTSSINSCPSIRHPGLMAGFVRDDDFSHRRQVVSHVRWMCEEGVKLCNEERRDKAMRWLGFVQGTLWQLGFFTIDQLKDHNRPAPVTITLDAQEAAIVLEALRALQRWSSPPLSSREKQVADRLEKTVCQ